jgi:hypothetical protein
MPEAGSRLSAEELAAAHATYVRRVALERLDAADRESELEAVLAARESELDGAREYIADLERALREKEAELRAIHGGGV